MKWVELKFHDIHYRAAIGQPLPKGPYIQTPQHSIAEYEGQPWHIAVAHAQLKGDEIFKLLNVRWGNGYYAEVSGVATLVAYYWDTSD